MYTLPQLKKRFNPSPPQKKRTGPVSSPAEVPWPKDFWLIVNVEPEGGVNLHWTEAAGAALLMSVQSAPGAEALRLCGFPGPQELGRVQVPLSWTWSSTPVFSKAFFSVGLTLIQTSLKSWSLKLGMLYVGLKFEIGYALCGSCFWSCMLLTSALKMKRFGKN